MVGFAPSFRDASTQAPPDHLESSSAIPRVSAVTPKRARWSSTESPGGIADSRIGPARDECLHGHLNIAVHPRVHQRGLPETVGKGLDQRRS